MDPLPTSAARMRLPAQGIDDAFALLDSIADGVIVVDVEDGRARVAWASRSCIALLGGADPRDRDGDDIRCLDTGVPLGRLLAEAPARVRLELRAAHGSIGVEAVVRAHGSPGRHALALTRLGDDWLARSALDLPLPALVFTRDMRIRWINDAAVRMTGMPRAELIGRAWTELVPEARERMPVFEAALAGDGSAYMQPRVAMTFPGQQQRWFRTHYRPLRDRNGEPEGLLAIAEEVTDLHAAEHAWQLAERRFDAVTDNLLDLVNVVAPDGTILMQAGSRRVSGRAPAERIGRSVYEYVHPDDLARYREWIARLATSPAGEAQAPIELRKLHADGSWRTQSVRGTNLLNVPGVGGLLLQVRDDTERQAAQQALRRTQQSLQLAIDAARLGFFEYDPNSDTLQMSDEFYAMRRLDPGIERARPRRDVWRDVHPEDRESVRAQLARVLADPTVPWDVEFRMSTGDGDWLWVLQFGRVHELDGRGRGRRLVGVVLDVDRRKRAERGLRHSESRYRTLVALVPGFLYESSFDANGHFLIRWASEGFTRLLGWTVEEVNARGGWDALVHADDVAGARQRREKVMRGGDVRAEVRLLTKSGNVVWVTSHSYPLQDPDSGEIYCLMGMMHDVTHLKTTEAALRRSEQRYRIVSELAPGFVYESSVDERGDTHVEWATHGLTTNFGWKVEELGGAAWLAQFHPQDRPAVLARLRRLLHGEETAGENRIHTADGRLRWARFLSRPERDPRTGRVVRIVGAVEDITERKQAEERLRESEFRYRTVAELTPGFVYEAQLDDDGWRIYWTAGDFEGIYGCSLERFHEIGIEHFYPSESLAGMRARAAAMRRGETVREEVEVRTIDGAPRWIVAAGRPIESATTGQYDRMLGVVEDITARKLAEQQLRESEFRYRAVAEFTPGFVFEADIDGVDRVTITWASSGIDRVYECGVHEVNARGWRSFQAPEPTATIEARLERLRAGEPTHVERRIVSACGNERWVRTMLRPLGPVAPGQAVRVVGVVEDITEAHLAAAALRASEERFRLAAAAFNGVIYECDLATGVVQRSRGVREVVGLAPEQVPPTIDGWRALVHPADLSALASRRALSAKPFETSLQESRYRVRHADGHYVDVWDRALLLRDADGRPQRWIGCAIDVTNERRMERLLLEAESAARVGSWEFDPASDRLTWSEENYRLHETSREDFEPTIERALGFFAAEYRDAMRAAVQRALADGTPWDIEAELIGARGRRFWIRTSSRPELVNGRVVRIYGACVDIDDQKRAQLLLKQQSDWLRMSFDAAALSAWRWFPDVDEAVIDHRGASVNPRGPEHGTLTGWLQRVEPVFREAVRAALEATARDGTPTDMEYAIRAHDGEPRWLVTRATRTFDAGRVVVTGTTQDVTSRREAEEQLRASEAVLRSVAENAPDFITIIDPQLRLQFANRPIRGIPPAAVVGRPVAEFAIGVVEEMHAHLRHVLATSEPVRYEGSLARADGAVRWYENRFGPIVSGGRVAGVIAFTTDITERRDAERLLRTQASVLTTMLEGVAVADDAGIVRLTNSAFDRMFGFDPGALERHPLLELFAEGHAPTPAAGGRAQECSGRRADGSVFDATAVVSELELDGQRHVVYVVQDVTERRALERELLEIANREQRRIGSDLHDGLGQELTGVALLLSGLASRVKRGAQPSAAEVDELVGLVNGAIESTRSLARGLSPVELERGGLAYALRSLAMRGRELYGLDVKFRSRVWPKLTLDAAATTHLYRIAQEALTNVARHAQATQVTIQLNARGRRVVLSVTDDGRGLPADGGAGMGLRIMRYRARMMGGELLLERVDPTGTRVTCRLQQPAPDDAVDGSAAGIAESAS